MRGAITCQESGSFRVQSVSPLGALCEFIPVPELAQRSFSLKEAPSAYHRAHCCPKKHVGTDKQLAGRKWSQNKLKFEYEDPVCYKFSFYICNVPLLTHGNCQQRVENIFCIETPEALTAVHAERKFQLLTGAEIQVALYKKDLADLPNYVHMLSEYTQALHESEINKLGELINELSNPPKPLCPPEPPHSDPLAASLSKLSAPSLSSRKRLVYRDFL